MTGAARGVHSAAHGGKNDAEAVTLGNSEAVETPAAIALETVILVRQMDLRLAFRTAIGPKIRLSKR